MKNIFTYGAMLCAALFLLVFAGCPNFTPQAETGLKITITSDSTKARTLYPSQPVFSKYVLEVTGEWGWQDKEYTLENGEVSKTIPLTPGKWNIKAIGFINILGNDYAAAEGTKEITVTDGIAAVSIDISVVQNASQNGFLFFSADYPEQAVSKAELYIYHVGSKYEDSEYHWILGDDTLPDPIYLDPGYYMMTLLMDVKDSLDNYYRTVAWTEVIHIYSGMETRAEKTFTTDDLNKFITLGGSLSVTINGNAPDEVFVRLFRDAGYTNSFGFAYINNTTGAWQTSIPVLNAPVVFYLLLEASYEGAPFSRQLGSVAVNNTDVDYPINVTFSDAITLSGTANVRINNVAVTEAWVVAYNEANPESSTFKEMVRVRVSNNTSWQMLLGPEYNGSTAYFWVIAIDRAKGYNVLEYTGISRSLNGDVSGINLGTINITTIKLSGTADIRVNGSRPTYTSVEVYRRQNTIWAASCAVDADNNYSWEIPLPVELVGNNIYIRVEGYDYNGKWFSKLLTSLTSPYVVPQTDATINFTDSFTN